ncbi:sensor histidine kinase [Paenibacillus tianjinensis]|uniref:GHKL domain-containing protein n=1 Tax=Paenibacillus tianjinensis TaxID=2810347 RepID=A0ABX7LBM1_9BACL|nr:sensor histidine kinase [Paenibacillus tianjinensis]QSF44188.1 GHKL domain-containing protein [Paenibacillus tianjinensis]
MKITLLFFLGTTLIQLVLLNRYFFALLGSSQQNKLQTTFHYLLSGIIIYLSSISFFPVVITGSLSMCSAFIISWCYPARIESKLIFSIVYVILGFVAETLSYGLISQFHLSSDAIDLSNEQTRLPILLLSSLIFFLFIVFIKLFKRQRDYKLNTWYYLILAVINIVSLFILHTLFFYAQENNMYIYSAIAVLLINVTIIYLFDELIESFQMKDELQRLHKQTEYQNTSYQKISNSFQMTKRIIHDTNKHFIYIRACIQAGEREKALGHISKTLQAMKNSYFTIATGNLVIDSLLNNAINISNERNIQITHHISIENLDMIDPFDLCIVIGNILDNAVEAAQLLPTPAERFIFIRIFTQYQMLTIYSENSYTPCNKRRIKKNNELHGVGLLNIRQITERYGGHLTVTASETFKTIVVLPINRGV